MSESAVFTPSWLSVTAAAHQPAAARAPADSGFFFFLFNCEMWALTRWSKKAAAVVEHDDGAVATSADFSNISAFLLPVSRLVTSGSSFLTTVWLFFLLEVGGGGGVSWRWSATVAV